MPPTPSKSAIIVATSLLAWSLALGLPLVLIPPTTLPGGAGTDSLRGAWSFFHAYSGLPNPILTDQVHFPGGALALPLPFVSALILSPLTALLGPFDGYTLACFVLVGWSGLATAWLARELGGSWALGALAGGAVMAQPMYLHAIHDGTPEHLALWILPAALASAFRAVRSGSIRWATAAGILTALTALDSPYSAIFGLVIAPFALPQMLARTRGRTSRENLRLALAALLPALLGLALVGFLFHSFDLQPPDTATAPEVALAGNSVDLRSWWQIEHRPDADVLGTLAPALLPTPFLVVALLLGLVGLPRSLPWLLYGGLALLLSLGTRTDNAGVLAVWFGAIGGRTGENLGWQAGSIIRDFNLAWTGLPILEGVRFPRRWLAMAATGFSLASILGLGRVLGLIRREVRITTKAWLGALAALALATLLLHGPGGRPVIPIVELPTVAFPRWIRDEAPKGAVLLLPTVRPAPAVRIRTAIPVFAGLGSVLSSSEHLYFQMLHRREVATWPALLTIGTRGGMPEAGERLIRDLNDLCLPVLQDRPPPGSAIDPEWDPIHAKGRQDLWDAGFRIVVLDLSVYPDPWLAKALQLLAPIAEQRSFSDGGGVVVAILGQ